MEKSVYNMKAEKIQKQVKQGDYVTAAKICDTIDWTQVRSARMLSLVSSVYEHVGRYETAIDILLMAYEEAPVGRRFLFKLTELAIASGNIREAEGYYKSYIEEAPEDSNRYVLRYKLARAKKEPIEKRIAILSAYKNQEFEEQWSFELAKLYDEIGDEKACIALCDEIILWFGAGPYVDKCKEIKAKYAPTEAASFEANAKAPAEEKIPEAVAIAGNAAGSGQQVSALDMSVFEPGDGEVQKEPEEEESFANTKRISAKDDFSRTRIFDKLPVNTAELKLFKTVTATDEENAKEQETVEEPKRVSEPKQMELSWDEPDDASIPEKKEKRIVYLGTSSPNEALEKAVEEIKDAHKTNGTTLTGIAKIAAPRLNTKGLINSLEALANKDVIILGASRLTDDVLYEINEIVTKLDKEKVFVLADSPNGVFAVQNRIASLGEKPEVKEPEPEIVVEEMAEPEIEPEINEIEPEINEPEVEPESEAEPEAIIPSEDLQEDVPIAQDFNEDAEELNLDQVVANILEEEPAEEEQTEEEESEPVEEPVAATPKREPRPLSEKSTENLKEEMSLSPEDFLEYLLGYVKQIDCVLAEGAEKELLRYFEELESEDEILDKQLAEDMVEDAADVAEKRSLGNLFHTRYDKNGNLILRAKNFV